jgi:hypothetical protein
MKSKGGPFFALINNHIHSAEYSFNKGDYGNCISHMKSLAELLNVKLPPPPYADPRFTPTLTGETSNSQRAYVIRYRPLIAKGIRQWMDEHTSHHSIDVFDSDEDEGKGKGEEEE